MNDIGVLANHKFREAIPGDHQCKFLIHDRDSSFSPGLDRELAAFGLRVLRTPVRFAMRSTAFPANSRILRHNQIIGRGKHPLFFAEA
jgi:hypothetical protein